jgi:hypothetical protein
MLLPSTFSAACTNNRHRLASPLTTSTAPTLLPNTFSAAVHPQHGRLPSDRGAHATTSALAALKTTQI